MEFKNCATGLGWDEAKQTVVCSQEWWDEHLAAVIVNIFSLSLLWCALLNFLFNFRDATIVTKESNAIM